MGQQFKVGDRGQAEAAQAPRKRDPQRDYWRECISIAAEDCGLALTDEQLSTLADSVQGGHENYGMAFYSPPAGERLTAENDRLRRALASERAKVGCDECGGAGRLRYNAGPWAVDTQCHKCHGEGKVSP